MNKRDLIYAIKTGLTKRNVVVASYIIEKIVDGVFLEISKALENGDSVNIKDFGNFKSVERAKRIGRNPKENTPVIIPKRMMPVFVPAENLKKKISDKGGKVDVSSKLSKR